MKIILLFLFSFTTVVFAQYTKNDKQLAATTFTRNFDKVTTTEYLKSENDERVIAGLLSVGHSEDTNYVPVIISLPADKFTREICFTLGQLGHCEKSIQYLQKLFYQQNTDPLTRYYALVALGKIADSTYAGKLVSDYTNANSKSEYNGISLALYYLFVNGKISADKIRPIVENELYFSSSRQSEAAFCLYRVGPDKDKKELLVKTLIKIFGSNPVSAVTGKPVPYLLASLRKLKYFPDDFSLVQKIKELNDFQTQVEAVRASVYYNFKTKDEVNFFLNYLDNDNDNISREAASAIKNINIAGELKDFLGLRLGEKLHQDHNMEKQTQGELLISYLSLFPQDFNDVFIKFFNKKISPEYLYKVCSFYPGSKEALSILSQNFFNESLPGKISILESILNFDQNNAGVSPIMISSLNSDQPALISIAAEGADSSFIQVQKDTLTKIIEILVEKHLDDPDFIESLLSLENLSGKISPVLKQKVISLLSNSDLYSIKRWTTDLKGESIRSISKSIDDFENYWSNAFEYKQAEIVTERGSITISFFPGYAPVSVGSFCFLAERHFFDGTPFHRVVPGFVIQGGDPTGTGWGGPGYEIVSEFSSLEYNKGMVGMASAGKDTEGSQWFITTGSYPHLNGKYSIFAEVLKGMDIVDKISQETKISRINLIR